MKTGSKTCLHCGAEFFRDTRCTHAYWARAKYCSRSCFSQTIKTNADVRRAPIETEFAKHFEKGDGCWEWNWLKDKDGYGLFPYAKVMYRAPKIALALDGRPAANGQYACHTCDNPGCVRPSHLYPGTPLQNSADAKSRNRTSRGEKVHFSKITEDLVRQIRFAQGTHEKIALEFGISRGNVSLIRARKTWKHVA